MEIAKVFVHWDRRLWVLPGSLSTFKTYLQCIVIFNSLRRVLGLFSLIMWTEEIFFQTNQGGEIKEGKKGVISPLF